jgi:hypothetical protein
MCVKKYTCILLANEVRKYRIYVHCRKIYNLFVRAFETRRKASLLLKRTEITSVVLIKKATGYDGISPKIIKFAQPVITNPIKVLVNKSIDQSVFPEKLKAAQVSPLFKKNNSLDKSNYRPISVFPTISKFYERTIFDQLMEFLNNHFNPLLSAFRSGFGCQAALLRIIED